MNDFLLQAILSNLIIATVLAILAWQIQRWTRSASLANLLWAVVLIKIVTPPMFAIPILEIPSIENAPAVALDTTLEPHQPVTDGSLLFENDHSKTAVSANGDLGGIAPYLTTWFSKLLIPVWIAVSSLLFAFSAFRIVRFHLLLINNSQLDHELTAMSAKVANDFRLLHRPDVLVTAANIAPFVWWISGQCVIVISQQAKEKLTDRDLQLVIAHEMAHIKRRDHLFRWLEWLCVTLFWWNPVMWIARVQLRRSEEMACDDLVLQTATAEVHQYANSLINMAEILAAPAIRPPVLASAINGGGILEKRLKTMIDSNTWKVPTALRLCVILIAIFCFPLGVVYATQDFDAVERRLGGAVEAGEISLEQANVMLEALRRFDLQREIETKKKQQDLAQLERNIAVAVAAGDLAKAEAAKKLIEQQRALFRRAPVDRSSAADSDSSLDLPPWFQEEVEEQKRERAAIEIKQAVAAGDLTPSEAKKKLESLHVERYRRSEQNARNVSQMEQRRRRFSEFAEELEQQVKSGEMSKKDAELRLIEMRRRMDDAARNKAARDDRRSEQLAVRKQRYMQLAEELKAAVEAGKMSAEEVEKKLLEIRAKMFGEQREKSDRDDAIKQKYMQIAQDVEAALAAGDLTEAQAQKKLLELKKEMAAQKEIDLSHRMKQRVKEREYLDIQHAIKEAVNSGELSEEDAKRKLMELKMEMDKAADKDKSFK